jgi:GntR family transcriptional repressor for pyruvate dehydrogenase complex
LADPLPHRRPAAGQVHAGLRELLDSGQYGEGARLPSEQELCLRLGVSRSAVREGLAKLSAEGRILVRKGSGSYVARPNAAATLPAQPIANLDDMLKRHDLRVAIECETAHLAADRWTRESLDLIDRSRKAVSAKLRRGIQTGQEDFLFHSAIAAATQNEVLLHAFQSLFNQIEAWIAVALKLRLLTPEQRLIIIDEDHGAIQDAIARRHPEDAARAMRRHLQHGRDRLLRGVAA